jgi:hypothetical protein
MVSCIYLEQSTAAPSTGNVCEVGVNGELLRARHAAPSRFSGLHACAAHDTKGVKRETRTVVRCDPKPHAPKYTNASTEIFTRREVTYSFFDNATFSGRLNANLDTR